MKQTIYKGLLFLILTLIPLGATAQYRSYKSPQVEKEGAGVDRESGNHRKQPVDRYGKPKCCETGNSNEFNFDLTFDYNTLIALDAQLTSAIRAKRKVDKWLKAQEAGFLKQINGELGSNHTSFEVAQKAYFTDFEKRKGYHAAHQTANRLKGNKRKEVESSRAKRDQTLLGLRALEAWKACGYCYQYKTLLNSIRPTGQSPQQYETAFRSWATKTFGETHYETGRLESELKGFESITKDDWVLRHLGNLHRKNYTNKGLRDRVMQMSVYFAQGSSFKPLPPELLKYRVPNFWNEGVLQNWAAGRGPDVPYLQRIFGPAFASVNPRNTKFVEDQRRRELQRMLDRPETDALLAEAEKEIDFSPLEMAAIYNRMEQGDPDCPDCTAARGTIANSGLASLAYHRKRQDARGNSYYNLNSGVWIGEFPTPRRAIGQDIPDGLPHYNGAYYYLYEPGLKGWVTLDIPVKSNGGFLNIDDYLGPFLLEAGKEFVAVATPIEDALILVTGRDLDGITQSRLEAGVWLVVGVVPGAKAGKVLKPALSAAKGARVGKVIKVGNTMVVRMIEPISNVARSRIINNVNYQARIRLDAAVKNGEIFKEVVEEAADEIADAAARKGRKLEWKDIMAFFKRGNDFNKKVQISGKYPFHEVNLIDGKRVDSYVKDKFIISRKATDLDKIQWGTFTKYVNEIAQKY
ncbi:MAG: hypothetical protein AAGF77_07155, partial [Bacteroidota bacterium]